MSTALSPTRAPQDAAEAGAVSPISSATPASGALTQTVGQVPRPRRTACSVPDGTGNADSAEAAITA